MTLSVPDITPAAMQKAKDTKFTEWCKDYINDATQFYTFPMWILDFVQGPRRSYRPSKGILVICGCFWASVGHKICSDHIMASPSIDTKGAPSIDTKGAPSIDSPSSTRQLPLAR
ncbi:hypothetical protein F2Q70_00001972 [Brassica cretica]|uniref:Uncharacterized protein n=1 Tax=Brassica cretica TaxID=69181 RepID=A0A8S9IZA3_BRACR|nr:hypothetical protein F2Q70_00001972 [Brassica cretica]